jgi:hypothetical protein
MPGNHSMHRYRSSQAATTIIVNQTSDKISLAFQTRSHRGILVAGFDRVGRLRFG